MMEVLDMCDGKQAGIGLLVDLKKQRIRIRRTTIHQLGDPEYIQLLVNPEDRIVAIRAVDQETSRDQTHWIGGKLRSHSGNSLDIHSRSFMEALASLVKGLDFGNTYTLSGAILFNARMAVFPLKTIRKMPGEGEVP